MRERIPFNFLMCFISLVFGVITGCSSMSGPTSTPGLTTSPISGWVVYSSLVSHDPFVTQIFLENLETGEITQLTDSRNNRRPRWSSDGSQIMFTRTTEENSDDIYIMNRDGSHQRPIVASSTSESQAEWSPDGKQITFVSNEDGNNEIYVMDLSTQVIAKLTNGSEFSTLPAWSSSGEYIAFESSSGGPGRSQIFMVNADGENLKQITNYDIDNFDGSPIWCPDDSCLIFIRFVEGVPKLMLLDLESSEVTPLLEGVFEPDVMEVQLARSPSREYITFSVGEMFYTMNMRSGEIFPLGVEAMDLSLYP